MTLLDASVTRLLHDILGLVPECVGYFLVLRQHLFWTERDFDVARSVRRDLGRSGAFQALLFKMGFDLLAAGAAGLQIFLCVAPDFRCAVLAGIK